MTNLLIATAVAVATNRSPVVVEASRLDRTTLEIPSAVRVIGSEEIAASGARDVVDLLAKEVPGLHVRHLGAGNLALAEVAMRGYGENGHGRTLVLVDGERLNSPDMNVPNLSRIAMNSVSKIEVLGGAQTVLQGDGASAGVVNVITEPQTYERKSYAEVHVGSWGTVGAALGTRGGIAEDGVKYWADGSYDRSDGYREHSGYDIWNLNGGIKKEWESGTSLRVSGFYNDSQYDLPGALTYGEYKYDPRQSHATEDRYHRSTYGFNMTFNAQLNEENALKVTENFSNRKMWAHQKGTGWVSDNEYDIYSFRILTEWINTSRLFGFDDEFVLGVQHSADLLDGLQKNGYTRQNPDYCRQSMDYYAQDTFRFTDWFALQLGGRYSRSWAFNDLCEKKRRNDNLGAFDAALVLNPTDDSKVYVKESRFYRNPFLDEVPGRYDAGYNWVNTRILAPETGWTMEFGADWDLTEELAVGADVYFTRLEDEIFYNVVRYNNENSEDPTWRRGFDAYVIWERDKLAGLSVAASFVKATFDGGAFDGNHIPLVPEMTVSVNGRVWLWNDCFVFGGYRYQSDMYSCSDFNNEYDKMGWSNVFHVGVTYEPTFVSWMEGFKFSMAVDNLFDESYCDYATYGSQYYPGAGRCLTFTVRYEF